MVDRNGYIHQYDTLNISLARSIEFGHPSRVLYTGPQVIVSPFNCPIDSRNTRHPLHEYRGATNSAGNDTFKFERDWETKAPPELQAVLSSQKMSQLLDSRQGYESEVRTWEITNGKVPPIQVFKIEINCHQFWRDENGATQGRDPETFRMFALFHPFGVPQSERIHLTADGESTA